MTISSEAESVPELPGIVGASHCATSEDDLEGAVRVCFHLREAELDEYSLRVQQPGAVVDFRSRHQDP